MKRLQFSASTYTMTLIEFLIFWNAKSYKDIDIGQKTRRCLKCTMCLHLAAAGEETNPPDDQAAAQRYRHLVI